MSELATVAPERLGPPTFEEFFDGAMRGALFAREFGTYCHEGGDLVADTVEMLVEDGYSAEDLYGELRKDSDGMGISWRAEKIIDEFERDICNYCEGADEDDDEEEGEI